MTRRSIIVLAMMMTILTVSNSAKAGERPTIHPESPTTSIVLTDVGDTIEFKMHGQDVDGDLRLSEMYLNGDFQTYVYYDDNKYDDIVTWSHTFTTKGVYIVGANVLDHEGNYNIVGSSCKWTVFVGETPAELIVHLAQDVYALNLPKGTANSLLAKLHEAYQKLMDGNDKNDVAAINKLEAFINAVEAQRGKKIAEADADALITLAQAIIDKLKAG